MSSILFYIHLFYFILLKLIKLNSVPAFWLLPPALAGILCLPGLGTVEERRGEERDGWCVVSWSSGGTLISMTETVS